MARDRVAYFKTLRLGDMVRGPEKLSIAGQEAQFIGTYGGTKPILSDQAGQTGYELEVTCHLLREFSGAETYGAFFKRKLAFLKDLKTIRGWGVAYTANGVLAVCESTAANFHQTTGSVSAGASADIPIGGVNITVVGTEYWFIADTVNHEIFTAAVGSWTNGIRAANLAKDYASGARIFRPLYYLPAAQLQPGTSMDTNDPAANQVAKNVSLRFAFVDDPVPQP